MADFEKPSPEHAARQKKTRMMSLALSALCIAAVFIGSGLLRQREGFTLGDFSGVSAGETLAAYEKSEDARDLILYLKVLCYRAEVEGEAALSDEIAARGTELLNLAREETIDLEALGDEDETLLSLLKLIRSYGAK